MELSGLHQLALLDISLSHSHLYPDSFQHTYLQVEYWVLLYPNIIIIINLNLQNAILFISNCSGKWEKQHLSAQIFQGKFVFLIRKLNILIRVVYMRTYISICVEWKKINLDIFWVTAGRTGLLCSVLLTFTNNWNWIWNFWQNFH